MSAPNRDEVGRHASGFRAPTDPALLASMRFHWYAGDSSTQFEKLVSRAQADANRTTDRAAVHAHVYEEPCNSACLIVAPAASAPHYWQGSEGAATGGNVPPPAARGPES